MRSGVIALLVLVVGCKVKSEDNEERGAKELPGSCVAYRKLLDKLPACDGVSKHQLAAYWQGYEDASSAWVNRDLSRMPANTMRAIDVACVRGRDVLASTLASSCPERVERDANDLFGASPQSGARSLPPTCEEYRSLISRLMSCEQLPRQSRDALRQGFEAMSNAWREVDSMPLEAKQAMSDACAQARDALKQAVSATCGW